MCVAVGAVVAKVARKVLAILAGDKNGRKFLGYVIGIVLFIVLLPVIAVYGLFGWMAGGGATEIVSPDMVYSAMPAEYRERMEQYNAELSMIETTFAECGVSGTDTSLAKTIYISCLIGKESEENFYRTYVDCFLNADEEHDPLQNISSAFGVTFTDADKERLKQLYGGYMNFKARFERKANAPQVTDADIVGVVTLNQEQFAWFSERLLDDYDFIADYAKETYDDGERKHCLLVLGEGEDDGILVCSEGSFYARYSAYLPKARQILRDEVHRVAELMIKGRFGETENGSWVIGFDDIKEHFDLTVSPTNGIGEMLLGELEAQEEVGAVIATEDCFEISEYLQNAPEDASASERLLTVFSLMGCNLEDVHLLDADEEHEVATIVELNQNTLTDEGKRDWSDVLAAKVERIYDGAYGTQIEVSGCPAHRLRDFSFALAGYCSEEQWSKWFNEPIANTEAPTMGEQA